MGEFVGNKTIEKLQEAGVIPKELSISRVMIDIQTDSLVKIYYETYADGLTIDFCLEELIKNKNQLIVKRVTERMTKG